MNFPKTPRQRTKEKALEQRAELDDYERFHSNIKIKTPPTTEIYRTNYDKIFGVR